MRIESERKYVQVILLTVLQLIVFIEVLAKFVEQLKKSIF